MAGYRRRNGRPKTREVRLANRREARARHLERLAAADSASKRLWAATSYLQSALRAVPTEQADRAVDPLIRDLFAAGDALLTPTTRRTNR